MPAPDAGLWRILLLAMLLHGLYPFLLVAAYRHGDPSAAFPLARGIAPLTVAILALVGGDGPKRPERIAGALIIAGAIASLALERGRLGTSQAGKGLVLAVATGIVVGCYTIVDSIGLHMGTTPWTFIVWFFVLDGVFVTSAVGLVRWRAVPAFLRENWRSGLLAGILGVATYGLVLYALAIGSVVQVAALRETSVIFGAIFGTFFLREPFGRRRLVAAIAVASGAAFMHAGR